MIEDKCPKCGAALVPGKEYNKAVCPDCGEQFDYNTIKLSARRKLDEVRWAAQRAERAAAKAYVSKRVLIACSVLSAALFLPCLIIFIVFCVRGDYMSFGKGGVVGIVIFCLLFPCLVASSIKLMLVVRKKLYSGVKMYCIVGTVLGIFLIAAIPVFVHGMHHYGRTLSSDGYIYEVTATGTASIIEYRGAEKYELVLPTTLGGHKVTRVHNESFKGNGSLRSVTVGEGVTNIGAQAFMRCGSLSSVSLPSTLTSIGYETFRQCTSLTTITLPDSTTYIGENIFSGCNSLTTLTVPHMGAHRNPGRGGQKHLGYFFGGRGAIEQADHVPKTLRTVEITSAEVIHGSSLSRLPWLSEVRIKNATRINSGAFMDSTGITTFVVPDTVTIMEGSVFANWTAEQTIIVPATADTSQWEATWTKLCGANVVYR